MLIRYAQVQLGHLWERIILRPFRAENETFEKEGEIPLFILAKGLCPPFIYKIEIVFLKYKKDLKFKEDEDDN